MSRAARAPIPPWQEGWVVGGVWLVVYLLGRTRDFGGDGIVYALAVERFLGGLGLEREFLHPHHPLYNPLVALVATVFRPLFGLPVLDAGAAVSALAAASVIGGLVVLLRRAGYSEVVAALAASAAGAAGGFWRVATSMEVYTLAAVGVVVWLAVLGRSAPSPFGAGLALAAAALGHLAAGVLAVATALRLRRPRKILVAALVAGVALAVAMALVLLLGGQVRELRDISRVTFPGGQYLEAPRPQAVPSALRDLAVSGWYRAVPVWPARFAAGLDVARLVVLALLAWGVTLGVVGTVRRREPLAVAALLGALSFLLLWLVWDVGNVEHTIAATPLFAVLLAVAAGEPPRRMGEAALLATFLLLVVVNGFGSVLPRTRAENSAVTVVAAQISARLPEGATVVSVGTDARVRLGLRYLSSRKVVDLTFLLDRARNDSRPAEDALAVWARELTEAPSAWATADVFAPEAASWLAAQGLPVDAWARVRSSLHAGRRFVVPADGVVLREPFVLTEVSFSPG